MSEKLKYVRTQADNMIIFPCVLDHSDFKKFNPKSAGFCQIRTDKRLVNCYGESFSLKLSSDPKDDSIQATREVFGINAMIELLDNHIN